MQIRCTQADHQNQSIIGICIESYCQYQRPYCHHCLPNHVQHINKLIPLENLNDWIQRRMVSINDLQKNALECKQILDSLINIFIPYLNINIEQFGILQIDNRIKGLCQFEVFEQQLFNPLKQSIQKVKQIIDDILKKTKSQIDYNQKIILQVQQPQFMKLPIQKQNKLLGILKQSINPFTYQHMQQYSVQSDWCGAIAINKDCSTLVAGCNSQIKVFEFKQGMLKQIQTLTEHNNSVFTLNFMKKQNQFISGSCDKSIIIWQFNQNNQWISQQRLNGHNHNIYCVILNNNEDIIISGSSDKTIKFWMKQNEWLCQQTITDPSSCVYGLSLNQQQNRVISCSYDKQILILEQSQQNKEWIVIQNITVEQYGYRICFIDNNMFTFQPYGKEQMSIFEMNSINNKYNKIKDINIKCGSDSNGLFFQQYINQKCMLMSKSGEYVNLIRKKQNGEFVTEQSIHFGTNSLYGVMSDDGEYLITWDKKSNQIQIRIYNEV
ncbi:unnamed protein product [Paramecium sonneborni]|uniref:WD domain, G-beta repeat protein n=1 Tax=Paramecium sonneborni TaxID=65129 RepID=A0A8S1RK36_9CILI|nr:unnamed protein product [Paramecium sonneborni]